jgi:hypothetical protein
LLDAMPAVWARLLSFAVNDPALGQIVGRKLDANAIAGDDADKMLAHPARDMGHDNVSTFDLYAKSRVRQRLRDDALDL